MKREVGQIVFVGLDLATKAGIAVLEEDLKTCTVYEVKGNPYEQLYQIQEILAKTPAIWGIEELHIFRNAKTIRSLAERVGFIKWTIKGLCKEKVYMIQASRARKEFGVKTKKQAKELIQCQVEDGGHLTDNHSDAVLVAMMTAMEVLELTQTPDLPVVRIGSLT